MTENTKLDKFISERIDGRFEYEITADEVIIKFDTVPAGEHWKAINLSNEGELTTLASLLKGRIIELCGESVIDAKISLISVQEYRK